MSSEVPPKARIESLYVLKALCSFLVVVVHTQFCAKGALTPLLGIATPCFLTITGFLLYSADAQREQYKALKWARKTFLLSLACNALYLAFYLWDGAPLSRYGVEVLGLNLLTGHKISMHLWYLTAVWQGLLLLWLLRRYAPWLIRLAPLLYIIAYVLRAYGKQLFPGLDADTLFIMRANAIVTALPFLATVYLVHQYQERILKHINVIACTIGMVLLAYAEYALRQWLGGSSIYFLSTWPMVVMLMLLCCRYKPFTLPVVGYIGRAHSANIYYFHILVLIYANRLVPEYAAWQAVLVFAGTLPISCLFNTIINGYRKAANRIKACQEARAGV
jgi:hypothetical protein